jgi:hypothetical protein
MPDIDPEALHALASAVMEDFEQRLGALFSTTQTG